MRYYKNFWIFMNNPIAGIYLRWSYKTGINDLTKFHFKPDFNKENFTCLLCGVGNERTADEFIKFIIKRNPRAKIWIIDIAEEHLRAVQRLVTKKYSNLDIHVKKINAFELQTIICNESVDWIETDGFMEFFDKDSLEKLLTVWHALLKPDGFVTTRDYISSGKWNKIIDPLRNIIMRGWLGVEIYKHSKEDFDFIFNKTGMHSIEGPAFIPTYKRFLLTKK